MPLSQENNNEKISLNYVFIPIIQYLFLFSVYILANGTVSLLAHGILDVVKYD